MLFTLNGKVKLIYMYALTDSYVINHHARTKAIIYLHFTFSLVPQLDNHYTEIKNSCTLPAKKPLVIVELEKKKRQKNISQIK